MAPISNDGISDIPSARRRPTVEGSWSASARWNAVAWVALAVSAFISTAILVPLVGPEAYGIWATVVALKGFAVLLDGGLAFSASTNAARLAADPDTARARIRGAVVVSLVGGIAASITLAAIAWLPTVLLDLSGADGSVASMAMVLVALEAGLALATSPLAGVARGIERFDAIALAAIAQAIVSVVLLVALAPSLGIVGAGLALLFARAAWVLAIGSVVRRAVPGALDLRRPRADWREIVTFAGPIWLVALGTQVALGTDVPIVGAVFGAVAAGAYALGAVVPRTAIGLLYAIVDTAYPRIARRPQDNSQFLRRLLRVSTLLAGLGFSVIIAAAPAILRVWVGDADPLAVDVLRIYAVTWALNVPAHILSLQAIAGARQRRLVPIVIGEAIACLALSVVLAAAGSPIGPAVATLITLSVSNLVVVPLLIIPTTALRMRDLFTESAIGLATGATAGLVIAAIVVSLGLGDVGLLLALSALTLALAAALVRAALHHGQRIERLTTILRHGGYATWRRQRREVAAARVTIARARVEHPVIWTRLAPPLVSVRIATYNRGPLVRDRAIASALEQTYPNIEVIVVGDGCDAATEAAVRSIDDPRVRFENLGRRGSYPSDARYRWMVAGSTPMNRALDLARGEWIAPLDDDDSFTPDHVDVLLDACRSRDLELAFGVAEMEVEPDVWQPVGGPDLKEGRVVHAAVMFWAPLGVIRHDVEAWRLGEPADWNVWHRMRDAGARIGFVDHVVTRHYLERREFR